MDKLAHWRSTLRGVATLKVPDILRVEGTFFGELFCGCGVITLAMEFVGITAMVPWDQANGNMFDVLTYGEV